MQTFTFAVVAAVMTLMFSNVSFAGETPATDKADGVQQTGEAQQPSTTEQSAATPQDTVPQPEAQTAANESAEAPPEQQVVGEQQRTQTTEAEQHVTAEDKMEEKKE